MTFNTALSGLRAASTDLEVTGNNIANASTTGFKRSRAEFGDVYANSLIGGGSSAAGSGVLVSAIAQQYSQGNVSFTDNSLDLAINGSGFFMLEDVSGSPIYTRAGLFGLDAQGFITNNSGAILQGYQPIGEDGEVGGTPSALQVVTSNLDPQATSDVNINFNLDFREAAAATALFDPDDAESYASSTSLTIYDSLGKDHVLTSYYVKSPYEDNTWNMYAYIPNNDGTQQNVLSSGAVSAADVAAATTAATDAATALALVTTAQASAALSAAAVPFNGALAATATTDLGNAFTGLTTALASAVTTASTEELQLALDAVNSAIAAGSGAGGVATTTGEAGNIAAFVDTSLSLATTASTTAAAIQLSFVEGETNAPYFELTFNSQGALTSTFPASLTIDAWNPEGGANTSSTSGSVIASDFTINIGASTQYANDFSVSSISQNGFTVGQLSGLEINGEGKIFARYTNGQAQVLGGVALASFANEQGLSPQGNTAWAESSDSGQPTINSPQSGILGSIQSGALEESNVDLSEELVRLIIAQRNFQANAKTIETADTVQQ
ncbi:MAG TPA: flagellar hook protein FlgE, partial [Porticoccus sp.]|nr:flagellar hook protein FlgE [Porticoccus sp.]